MDFSFFFREKLENRGGSNYALGNRRECRFDPFLRQVSHGQAARFPIW